jgi:DNA polymerase-3 subunit alpha (Gram-positive type)
MALRISWFKVYRPIYYYAAYFSIRAKELDAEVFAAGKNSIRNRIMEIQNKMKQDKKSVTTKEENLLDELKIALEMVLRGYSFKQIDLNISGSTEFIISDDKKSLYMPFVSIESLGETVAASIIKARNDHPFTSQKDFETRTNITKTQLAKLKLLSVFDNMPEK